MASTPCVLKKTNTLLPNIILQDRVRADSFFDEKLQTCVKVFKVIEFWSSRTDLMIYVMAYLVLEERGCAVFLHYNKINDSI